MENCMETGGIEGNQGIGCLQMKVEFWGIGLQDFHFQRVFE